VTCPGTGSTGTKTTSWLFENWARTQRVLVPVIYNPTSVTEIVAAVLEVEQRQESVKAIGSGWAYGGVAVDDSTQNVISMNALSMALNGKATKAIIPGALRDGLKKDAARYLHVEAGIKVWSLNCMLDDLKLAMPTLGGSNGQSIAGAIATGTHGANVNARPIADAVAAIHLVGPGG
jgi:FAD/FMN-containing dehydrogenase